MNLVCRDNKVNYTTLDLITPSTGVTYADGTVRKYSHNTISKTTTNGKIANSGGNDFSVNTFKVIVWHVYGTISKDISAGITFYHIAETFSANDPTILYPVNQYNSTDYIDWYFYQTSNTINYSKFRLYVAACNSNYDIISTPLTVKLNVDTFAL